LTLTTLKIEISNHLAVVRFDRPDQLNAISSVMQAELIAELDRLERHPEVVAIVLTGNGRAFMAGADLKEYAAFDAASFRAFQARGRHVYERVERNQKIVVAAVNGYALGGGFEMVLACDLVVARRTAKMGLPEVTLGLVPGGGGTQRLANKIGPNRALELLVTGQPRTAEELFSWGLINRLCDDDPLAAATTLLGPVLEKPLEALSELKRLLRLSLESSLDIGLDREGEALQTLFESPQGMSRVQEFLARNKKE